MSQDFVFKSQNTFYGLTHIVDYLFDSGLRNGTWVITINKTSTRHSSHSTYDLQHGTVFHTLMHGTTPGRIPFILSMILMRINDLPSSGIVLVPSHQGAVVYRKQPVPCRRCRPEMLVRRLRESERHHWTIFSPVREFAVTGVANLSTYRG